MESELSASATCFQLQKTCAGGPSGVDNLPQECRFSWYWDRKEIENNSPSRKDGIDLKKEAQLRMLYCSFLQDIGMRLRAPQLTIATAIMFCHRFYLHQSHAKNEWQTVATACMFLASKVEYTPCYLDKVVRVAYETMYRETPDAAQRIQQKDVFEKQKALILTAERVLLCTIRFDFNIEHPYKPLHEAFRKLQIAQKDVRQTAWNFVNDWLRTTLCLQYKPNNIAAGSLYLAAKHHNVKLPSGGDCVWWQVLDVTPLQLDAVVRQMMDLLGYKRRSMMSPAPEKPKPVESPVAAAAKEEASSSPESCVLSREGYSTGSPSCDVNEEASTVGPMDIGDQSSSKQDPNAEDRCCEPRDPESPNGIVEDCQPRQKPDKVEHALNMIDVDRIKALLKMRKRTRESNKCVEALHNSSDDAWIERELEAGIEISAKRQRSVEIL